jgi:hypothetical protein
MPVVGTKACYPAGILNRRKESFATPKMNTFHFVFGIAPILTRGERHHPSALLLTLYSGIDMEHDKLSYQKIPGSNPG